jgi:predicted Zn-dependent peptidase
MVNPQAAAFISLSAAATSRHHLFFAAHDPRQHGEDPNHRAEILKAWLAMSRLLSSLASQKTSLFQNVRHYQKGHEQAGCFGSGSEAPSFNSFNRRH